MKFSEIEIRGWRQFSDVKIEFHPSVTILTGANGAGKSTIIKMLAQHFGWQSPLLATPLISEGGVIKYFSGVLDWLRGKRQDSSQIVGSIKYSNGIETDILVPTNGTATYNLGFTNSQSVLGLHIGSHRPVVVYQPVSSIPTSAVKADQAYQTYYNETIQRYQNSYTQFSPTYRMKEAIISMATFGPGNQYVQRDESIARLFGEFKAILSKILPPSIGFRDISIRIPDVVVVTDTGEFVIDAASGGLMALIDLAWQIFLYSHDKNEFVVVFDEPENHLHPSMQRTLLGRLVSAFPRAQFIVATHSPFIVSSLKDSSVYVLRFRDSEIVSEVTLNRQIFSQKLDSVNKAGTASEILRDVLGVPVTLPEWAQTELEQISSQFNISDLNSSNLTALRHRLDEAGLGEYYPDALRQMADRQ